MMAIGKVRQQRSLKRAVPAYIIRATKRYTEKLALADRLEMRADKTKPAVISTPATRWKMIRQGLRFVGNATQNHRILAERAYESAIEILQEVIEEFPEVIQHLDRYPVFGDDNCNVTPDPTGVPRMRYSRSRYVHRQSPYKETIKSLKLKALLEFIQRLEYQ